MNSSIYFSSSRMIPFRIAASFVPIPSSQTVPLISFFRRISRFSLFSPVTERSFRRNRHVKRTFKFTNAYHGTVNDHGEIVGHGFDNLKEFHGLVLKAGEEGADFIKIMTTGLLDFKNHGKVTGEPLEAEEVKEMVHIAHEEGFAVMSHTNGVYGTRAAIEAAWTAWNMAIIWMKIRCPCLRTVILYGFQRL
mgnify:CR=1 FL=1